MSDDFQTVSLLVSHLLHELRSIVRIDFVRDESVQELVVLLRMPSECMSIDRQTSFLSFLHECSDSIEVHLTVVTHNRSVLHSIARGDLIKVRDCHKILLTVLDELAGGDACS